MKIGILTFHRAHNYGAMLQCYALSTYLQDIGYDVQIIDYYPNYFRNEYRDHTLSSFIRLPLRSKLSYLYEYIFDGTMKRTRRKSFNNFLSYLPLSKSMDENNISYTGYDIIIIGSDQVWNKKLTCGEDNAFMGNLKHENNILVSYAASTEISEDIFSQNEYYRSIIDNFDFISTRENAFCEYLKLLGNKEIINVLDPVFLLSESQWSRIAIKPKEDKYLLIYTVPTDKRIYQYAEMVANSKKLKIIEIAPRISKPLKHNCYYTISPLEFVGFFKYADYVVTTSFHGTAFSILFRKQFNTILLNRPVDMRSMDILSKFKLKQREVNVENLVLPKAEINYENFENAINHDISASKAFITNFLQYSKQNI